MKTKEWEYSVSHIKALDGIRSIAILIVAWFHIWQQSWLQPIRNVEWLKVFHCSDVNFDWMVRTGAQMVDVMLLLSGFCLFLPYARSMVYGTEEPDIKGFYKKRVARIFPSYYFAVIVSFIISVVLKRYTSPDLMWKDIIPHLFFVHTYFDEAYALTKINGVLWTLAVEVQFYLIFPFIAKLFKKYTWKTYCSMVALTWMFDNWIVIDRVDPGRIGMWFNQLPTFLSTYANGMLACLFVVKMSQLLNQVMEHDSQEERVKVKSYVGLFSTAVMIFCLYVYKIMMHDLVSDENYNLWQMNNRYEFTMLFAVFIVAVIFSVSWVQKIFGNSVMRFLSGISFQLYIWHQFLSLLLKDNHIPFWEGETPPNMTGDNVWIWKYFLLCWGAALIAAIAGTYLLERPCTKWIMGLGNKKNKETKE